MRRKVELNKTRESSKSKEEREYQNLEKQNIGTEILFWMADIKDEYILEAEDCRPHPAEKRVPGYLIAVGAFAAAAAVFTAVFMQSGKNWFNKNNTPIQLSEQTQESEWESETEIETEIQTEPQTKNQAESDALPEQGIIKGTDSAGTSSQQTQEVTNDWIVAVVTDQETDFRIWDGNDEYHVEQINSQNCIVKYNEVESTSNIVYSEAIQSNAQGGLSQLFLVGKYKNDLFVRNYSGDGMATDPALLVVNLEDGSIVRKLEYFTRYTTRYIQADCDAIITNVPDNGYGPLYLTDLNTGEEQLLASKCRMVEGDYIKNHVLYFLEPTDETYTQFHLIGYDLQKREKCQDIALPVGTYEAWRGCFIRQDSENGNQILLYDGTEYPYDGISSSAGSSLNRYQGRIVDYSSYLDGNNELRTVLRVFNEDSGAWEEWVDLSEYGVIPENAYSVKLEKGKNGILLRFLDANLKQQTVELYETLEETIG